MRIFLTIILPLLLPILLYVFGSYYFKDSPEKNKIVAYIAFVIAAIGVIASLVYWGFTNENLI